MDACYVPAVNHLASHGRWAFAEFGDVFEVEDDFAEKLEKLFDTMIENVAQVPT